MSNTEQRPYVPTKTVPSEYPLIDSDPHFKRVVGYARPGDYAFGAVAGATLPATMLLWEKISPSYVGKGGFAPIMRLTGVLGLGFGFLTFYQRSILRFYGWTENSREVDMDMKEMVEKVKAGKPLYGESTLTPYMQGVAARNSRYTGVWFHIIPWFNFVNHNQHGVDTAKYYQAAEKELEGARK
ncbi:putative NADH-ubiquinone oxidoreductase subunit 1 [Coleophoma crateriformis]|uniref:Putative NADH-ubiquinone oxidoreductase subunit 1 n=1 Tax=Coleophoma crateriformis TaxID=565419 RepID=A0A3D8QYD8_9HELO|nr:putative NADH-ubiquinone oxidoreductase subunit 1 [Coleophoma crateriformis]